MGSLPFCQRIKFHYSFESYQYIVESMNPEMQAGRVQFGFYKDYISIINEQGIDDFQELCY